MIPEKLSYAICAICLFILSGILICGCSDNRKPASSAHSGAPRDPAPQVLVPEASGSLVEGNEFASIDASHTEEGYFMVCCPGSGSKIKLRVLGPKQSEYTYLLSGSKDYETFPLPCGNGSYQIQVLEDVGGDMYAVAFSTTLDVTIQNEFGPFLYPNQYVNFTKDSQAVSKGSELARDSYSDLEVIEHIYRYVTGEISYDTEKARTVTYGYLPSIDETLASKKGICFDYAALMCAMLRTQGIPAKLEIGYSGEAYHAWISAYTTESGWIDNVIMFDGKSWTLMDPTLAAGNNREAVKEYVGDASHYVVKYSY